MDHARVGFVHLHRILQVVPGAEGPVTGSRDDGHPRVVVLPVLEKGVGKLACDGVAKSVQPVGPVYRDEGDAVPRFVLDELVAAHSVSVLGGLEQGQGDLSLALVFHFTLTLMPHWMSLVGSSMPTMLDMMRNPSSRST